MTHEFVDSREGFSADEFDAHQHEMGEPTDGDWDECTEYWDDYDDSMDGDFDSAMRDAGWGTDEDYGYYGQDEY